MDREHFHWGAITEIMEITQRREKSPETRRFVERRLEIARPGMTRSRYDQNAQRTIWVPSRPKKKKQRRNRRKRRRAHTTHKQIGEGYRPIQEAENEPEQFEMEEQPAEERINDSESERESQIARWDNLPFVDLKNYNTEGKEAHYVQINQIIGTVTEGKKITEETNKKRRWTSCWI